MAVTAKGIFDSVSAASNYGSLTNVTLEHGSGFLQASGLTAGFPVYLIRKRYDSGNSVWTDVATAGFATADSNGDLLAPYSRNRSTYNGTFDLNQLVLVTTQGASVATFYYSVGTPFENTNVGNWQITQDANKNVKVQIVDYQTTNTYGYPFMASFDQNSVATPSFFKLFEVSMHAADGSSLATQSVSLRPDKQQPYAMFAASTVSVTGQYLFFCRRCVRLSDGAAPIISNGTFGTTLTAPTVTSGSTNMHSWLDNSYWYLTDLQVNLGTRAVTSRQGSINLRPSDTINFAILFNDGSQGVNPQATDIKLAVRSSNNTSPYHFWSAATVSTVTVSGDVYYAITVTASDDDLLSAQAANLLAGSNAAQSLLGEIQWTTTRGTFSSDTFTINVPSEVVREPDV